MEQSTATRAEMVASAMQARQRLPRGRVKLFNHWCKGCGLCIAFCPQQVLGTNGGGRAMVVHPERCTACDWCRLHCPDLAITVEHLDGEEVEGQG